MIGNRVYRTILSTVAACALMLSNVASSVACTGIRLKAQDGSVVAARTLEFAIDLHSDVLVIPRGYARTGTTPDGKEGLKWTAKYASVGANGVGMPVLFDGLNEKGLYAGLFYFPTSAGYMPYAPADAGKTIAPWELGSWMLENFASVEEVKAHIGDIVVPAVVFAQWGFAPEVHFRVQDASGGSIVVEYLDGKLRVFEAPLGVITNSPSFDWHMTNLRNYVNFSMTNHPPVQLGPVTLEPFGQGTGMLGMPGDFTPPSRFVRAVAFSQSVLPSKTGDDAVLDAFHILNQFDIPKGSARGQEKDAHGNIEADYTIWTAASNLKTLRYYFRTYDNSQIRMLDLAKMNPDAKDIATFSMKGEEIIKSLNP
ncbi:linear amide C-N hydrolase [Methylocella silvestris]|uniref:Choloylglycine hydrolase n=1 Tax=Methylocella silvestris TaxID=199596 RepID=A0A2J7TLI8_METSI|nr:choloylglycine hydrolase family protein [Methylocella silvestris]PNG27629.1 choloylglycine hydrolase [Methylocella silvestris]